MEWLHQHWPWLYGPLGEKGTFIGIPLWFLARIGKIIELGSGLLIVFDLTTEERLKIVVKRIDQGLEQIEADQTVNKLLSFTALLGSYVPTVVKGMNRLVRLWIKKDGEQPLKMRTQIAIALLVLGFVMDISSS